MNHTVFELRDVVYAYPQGEPVLRGLRLDVEQGERVCILGANGCGKSTLLKLLCGLLLVQGGRFTAFGAQMDARGLSGRNAQTYHRRVGFVFQDADMQLFCSTVFDELAFGPLQMGLAEESVRRRVEELAELLDIRRLLDKPPFHLSGGEKKKVAIASALIMGPEVLILDEPTNDLDPRSRTWLLRLLNRLHEAGKTLIFATHDLRLLPSICDRAVLFGEDHAIAADMPVYALLQNRALLRQVNLIDEKEDLPACF